VDWTERRSCKEVLRLRGIPALGQVLSVVESSCSFVYVKARGRYEDRKGMASWSAFVGNSEGGAEQVLIGLILQRKAPRVQRIACFFAEGRKRRPYWVTLERGPKVSSLGVRRSIT
jgi:hypothetical protein